MTPPRSLLYVPAFRAERLATAPFLAADAYIVDLEDGIGPDEKERARETVRRCAEEGAFRELPLWMLRVNAPGSPWHEDDLSLAEALRPPLVVLPKSEDPQETADLAGWFAGHETGTALMIETAAGVARARELAAAHEGVEMLILGSADLRRSLRAQPDGDRMWERHAMAEVLLAARARGLTAIDSAYFHFRDAEGLKRHASIGRRMGYDGASCIHPAQIPVLHEVFAPTPEEVAWAERVLAEWDAADRVGRGVVVVEGEMIESLHAGIARRILNR